MSERELQSNSYVEKTPREKLIAGSIGGLALALTAGWAANKLFTPRKDSGKKRASRTPEFLTIIADSFDIPLSTSDVAYWETIAATYRAIDDIVDENKATSLDHEALSLICGQPISGLAETDAKRFSALIHDASEDKREAIMSGLEVNNFAEKLRNTSNINEMLTIRREESVILSRIMSLENPKHDPSIEAFNSWMAQAGESAYHVDTVRDLRSDYLNGVTNVTPTPKNYFAASKEAARTTYLSLSYIPLKAIIPLSAAGLKLVGRALIGKKSQ